MSGSILKMGAIVSTAVAEGRSTILLAVRDTALDPADSGWQFTAGEFDPSLSESPQLWRIEEVLELEPSLAALVNRAPGARLMRSSKDADWTES
ncbi:immunity protein Imm33 domain-containing protein [Sphingomonas sp.]|uniref:immunity protein Imm33 domain-containing protein n=1 Tax=Sphingomonas sp. TaxID=28214 RepID=UPI0039C9E3D8